MEWRAAAHLTQLTHALVFASFFYLPGLAQPLKNNPQFICRRWCKHTS